MRETIKWVPVSERMPDADELVLIACKLEIERLRADAARYRWQSRGRQHDIPRA